jgi:triacylglycerol esterase/lipase EstA (alpha/beta hydrolase family)
LVDGGDDTDGGKEADGGTCDPAHPEVVIRGHLMLGSAVNDVQSGVCCEDQWTFAAAEGNQIEIRLVAHGLNRVELAVVYPDERSWDDPLLTATAPGGMSVQEVVFEPPRSGEFAILVRTVIPAEVEHYDIAVRCLSGCDFKSARYPFVLVHGWTGFESIGPLTYFYDVREELEGHGFRVHVPVLDPYNSVEVRSVQLALAIKEILRTDHARRVNLIAHSQGGLDARRAISTLGFGDRVSALVTVATPHRGTPIADLALGYLPGPGQEALYFLLEYLGAVAAHSRSDAEASFYSLSEHYVRNTFNPQNPDDPRVTYISWTGKTCPLGISCGDICDVEIRWSYDLIYLMAGANDGMVPVSSGAWGDFRGEIPADHFDEVGQLAGVTGPNFDHRTFYLDIARELAVYGH